MYIYIYIPQTTLAFEGFLLVFLSVAPAQGSYNAPRCGPACHGGCRGQCSVAQIA